MNNNPLSSVPIANYKKGKYLNDVIESMYVHIDHTENNYRSDITFGCVGL